MNVYCTIALSMKVGHNDKFCIFTILYVICYFPVMISSPCHKEGRSDMYSYTSRVKSRARTGMDLSTSR